MSAPNDNKPSPAAVEQALAEAQANAEKIGATVQLARASATGLDYKQLAKEYNRECDDAIARGIEARAQCDTYKQERDVLQAQRDELLAMLERARQDINWMLNNRQFLNGHVFEYIDAAIARATEGGQS